MNIETTLKRIANTNPYPITGNSDSIWLESKLEEVKLFGCIDEEDYKEGDVIVSYDWMLDDIRDDRDKSKEWYEWNDRVYDVIRECMYLKGYSEIGDNDGSGNGLVYGGILFRK